MDAGFLKSRLHLGRIIFVRAMLHGGMQAGARGREMGVMVHEVLSEVEASWRTGLVDSHTYLLHNSGLKSFAVGNRDAGLLMIRLNLGIILRANNMVHVGENQSRHL